MLMEKDNYEFIVIENDEYDEYDEEDE